MSTIARRISANPARTASEAWSVITEILSEEGGDGRAELDAVAGVASSLIAEECFKEAPAIVSGSGPRVRLYCIYDEDGVEGNGVNENPLSFDATGGDWAMSLPCRKEDLDWIRASLKKKSTRITARDLSEDGADEEGRATQRANIEIDLEGFLNA